MDRCRGVLRSGVFVAGSESADAPGYSGVIALIAASSAFIALYQHRHKLDKTRPAVREDFEEREDGEPLDFGLRNYGPGSAHYIQAVATVEKEDDVLTVSRFNPHDRPIHLKEGEFVGLVHEPETNWLNRALDHYDLQPRDTIDEGCPAMVNLYYSYVSHSGAREPVTASSKREDENILDRLKDPDSDARRIELWRLEQECLSESSDSQT